MVLSKDCSGFYGMKHRRVIRYVSLSCRTAPPCEYALCPARTSHQLNACASWSWCLNQWFKLFPKNHIRKNLSLHPQRKELLLLLYKEIESAEHTPQCMKQRKRRVGNLSRFYGTPLVILSQWLVAQTWLNLHQTWWSHSSLKVLRCFKLVWELVE